MNYIFTIMKKELFRVFSDKKMIFSLFIMPAILVIGIYTLMGQFVVNMLNDQENHVATVVMINAPEDFKEYVSTCEVTNKYEIDYQSDKSSFDDYKDKIYSGDLDLVVEFDDSFADSIKNMDSVPDIKTYYNPSEDYSDNARSDFVDSILAGYKNEILVDRLGSNDKLTVFTVDATNDENVIQNDSKASGKLLGSFIPYLITILLFAGAMSLGIDTFAGEKERGTMASMLIAPIKRSYIVYGKLFALMILSGLSALVYGGSMIVAMPVMAGSIMGGMETEEVTSVVTDAADVASAAGLSISFNISQVVMLLVLIVSLVFVYVALIALPAVFAKDVKVGSTYVMPVYIIVMVSGMFTMFLGDNAKLYEYAIPLYGSAVALKNIFTTDITFPAFVIAVVSNLIFGGIIAFVVTRAFNSEKIMFDA